jgi:hypothetical protein
MNDSISAKRPRGTRWCAIGSTLAGLGLLLVAGGLLAGQANLLSPLNTFMAYGIGGLLCLIAILLLLVGLGLSKGSGGGVATGRAWGALLSAVLVIGLSLALRPDTNGAPPIHDLSTDLVNPPAFDQVIPLRAADGAQNPPEYAGEEFAAAQRKAFPDLVSLTVPQPAAEVFAAAEATARALGWEIVAADASAGRIEATDTTAWFRFRDDVVIRLTPGEQGTVVDVRSKSRVGMGDMGTNAARIRQFLDDLKTRLG